MTTDDKQASDYFKREHNKRALMIYAVGGLLLLLVAVAQAKKD